MKKRFSVLTLIAAVLFLAGTSPLLASTDSILKRWSKTAEYKEKYGGELYVTATYYSSEYIEALVQSEAEKNLWTEDEMENYRYQLLKTLKLSDYIPVHVAFDNRGPAMHMAPFGKQVDLWIGNKKYAPVDYDKRFNFKLLGKRDGMIYFPRYDEKTGKSLLEGKKSIRFAINPDVSSVTMGKTSIDFIWDVYRDRPEKLLEGRAAGRLEMDRLIRRLEKLNESKKDLESKLAEVQSQIEAIQKRVDEIQSQ